MPHMTLSSAQFLAQLRVDVDQHPTQEAWTRRMFQVRWATAVTITADLLGCDQAVIILAVEQVLREQGREGVQGGLVQRPVAIRVQRLINKQLEHLH